MSDWRHSELHVHSRRYILLEYTLGRGILWAQEAVQSTGVAGWLASEAPGAWRASKR